MPLPTNHNIEFFQISALIKVNIIDVLYKQAKLPSIHRQVLKNLTRRRSSNRFSGLLDMSSVRLLVLVTLLVTLTTIVDSSNDCDKRCGDLSLFLKSLCYMQCYPVKVLKDLFCPE
ncbi:hypothetical protein Y032_0118g712 [Ancylostoma ceylanicum]|uniref:Uncharacterized protein n=1 Tax=Ancylostoma ceylanicum TaxID=53326 RepID=A0A016TBI1_9BILA|nr:hypothetical protein Y032_0118g712 [Ancylostoma ceylanicum]